jgi:hypothetical protein
MNNDESHRLKIPFGGRPRCPKCDMSMIATGGFGLDPQHKTFECLQCGHIENPQVPVVAPTEPALRGRH